MPFFVTLILVIVGAIGLDQLTKWIVYFNLPIGEEIVVLDGVLEITHIRNAGMAFGLLSDQRWIFLLFSIVGISLVSVYLFKFSKDSRLTKIALALVIGGGIGNMIDRTFLGEVIDMIHVTVFNDFFPWVFNVADSCVCVGVFLAVFGILLDMVKEYRLKKAQGTANDDK
ncbi:MAG: signal peptidase II [Clostridia bacterium]|nr:signal peptidase II [Clostridia bacterium]